MAVTFIGTHCFRLYVSLYHTWKPVITNSFMFRSVETNKLKSIQRMSQGRETIKCGITSST